MIRVGHVVTNLWDGGIERIVLQIATGLPPEKFATYVYALTPDNPWKREFEICGIPVRTYSSRNRGGFLRTFWPNLRTVIQLALDLKKDRIRILNSHDFFPGIMGRSAAYLSGIPNVYTTLHNTYDWLTPRHGLVNRIFAHGTKRVISVSKACLQASQGRDKISHERYIVIPNGVDNRRFYPRADAKSRLLSELGWPDDSFIIGNVGTLSPRKDQATLIRAFSLAASSHPSLRLVIVGSQRKHEMGTAIELQQLAQSTNLADKIRFLSERKDIETLEAGFDVFCMPSRVEGFGLALIEAMLSGVPTTVSNIAVFKEIASEDGASLFHNVGDHQELSRLLIQLYTEPSLRKRLSNLGLQVGRRYTLQRMLDNYAQLYTNATSVRN